MAADVSDSSGAITLAAHLPARPNPADQMMAGFHGNRITTGSRRDQDQDRAIGGRLRTLLSFGQRRWRRRQQQCNTVQLYLLSRFVFASFCRNRVTRWQNAARVELCTLARRPSTKRRLVLGVLGQWVVPSGTLAASLPMRRPLLPKKRMGSPAIRRGRKYLVYYDVHRKAGKGDRKASQVFSFFFGLCPRDTIHKMNQGIRDFRPHLAGLKSRPFSAAPSSAARMPRAAARPLSPNRSAVRP